MDWDEKLLIAPLLVVTEVIVMDICLVRRAVASSGSREAASVGVITEARLSQSVGVEERRKCVSM
jgi:hypothetical protein